MYAFQSNIETKENLEDKFTAHLHVHTDITIQQ